LDVFKEDLDTLSIFFSAPTPGHSDQSILLLTVADTRSLTMKAVTDHYSALVLTGGLAYIGSSSVLDVVLQWNQKTVAFSDTFATVPVRDGATIAAVIRSITFECAGGQVQGELAA
jgi:hypothetical protein